MNPGWAKKKQIRVRTITLDRETIRSILVALAFQEREFVRKARSLQRKFNSLDKAFIRPLLFALGRLMKETLEEAIEDGEQSVVIRMRQDEHGVLKRAVHQKVKAMRKFHTWVQDSDSQKINEDRFGDALKRFVGCESILKQAWSKGTDRENVDINNVRKKLVAWGRKELSGAIEKLNQENERSQA